MRKEMKFHVTPYQSLLLKQVLKPFCDPDPHGLEYLVTTEYFDTLDNKLLSEKVDGVSRLGKVRLRYYNDDKSLIKLERKLKKGDWVTKEVHLIDKEIYEELKYHPEGLYQYFMNIDPLLVYKTCLTYIRTAYCYREMDVRFTFDRDLKVQIGGIFAHVEEDYEIFEIKYKEGLPVHLIHLLSDLGLQESISKYATVRQGV